MGGTNPLSSFTQYRLLAAHRTTHHHADYMFRVVLSIHVEPVFAHCRLGKNGDPEFKCVDFARFLEEGGGNRADMAFLKFCYVDVTTRTDVNRLFTQYKEMMSSLREKYPRMIFIHFSVPVNASLTDV